MVEWSITAVLKTAVLRGTGGSNPSLSAINIENQCFTKQTPDFTPKNVKSGVFVLFKKLCGTLAMKSNIATVDTHKKFPHIVIKKGTTFSSVQK